MALGFATSFPLPESYSRVMIAALTGIGLSAAAGLNAYVPFLIVALIARFTDVLTLPSSFSWMESWWAIGIGSLLLLTEVAVDKIPAVDTINDAVQSFIRPSMGGLIFAATSAAETIDKSQWMQDNQWVGIVLGIIVSGLVHSGKMVARPAINAGTLGAGAPVVSTMEDGASIGLSLIAIFIPILVILALLLLFGMMFWVWRKVRKWRQRRRQDLDDAGVSYA